MRSRLAQLSTCTLRYLESGEGRPVLFIHGFPLGAEMWLPQLSAVPDGWRFVAPDLRGFGGAEPVGAISIDVFAADLIEFMAHLEMPSALVVGLSMGGYVALAMARRAPRKLAGLLLADTRATPDSPQARAGRQTTLDTLHRDGPLGVGRSLMPKLLGVTAQRERPDLADAVTRIIEANTPDGIEAALLAIRDRPDATPGLAALACPTTVVVGDEDVMTPPDECEALARLIPGARFVRVPHAGHLSNIENAAAFTSAVVGVTAVEPVS